MDVGTITSGQYFGTDAAKPKSDLDMQTFLQLLVSQLQNQNPLEPMDDASFYAQVAQLGQVQGLNKINNTLSLSQASSLMDKNVTANVSGDQTASGLQEQVTGKVTKVTLQNGDYKLRIEKTGGGTVDVKMDAIIAVG